jgi:1,4-dihydroxy-2-naphthoate octaprenyltransferase
MPAVIFFASLDLEQKASFMMDEHQVTGMMPLTGFNHLMGSLKIWLLACRPKTLWASVAPVIIGTAMAYSHGTAHWFAACFALVGAGMIQIGTNFANDYFDFVSGVDNQDRLGPVRVTQAGFVSPRSIKTAFTAAFFLAAVCGIYLVCRAGWPLLLIGVLSILFGLLYTGGPFPLGYTGIADFFVLLFFGPVAVAGTYYAQALRFDSLTIIAGLAPGLFSVAILTVNNLRDIHTDKQAGKKTLAVRFGRTFARMEYLVSLATACLVPVWLYILSPDHSCQMFSGLVFFGALPCLKIMFRELPGPMFNHALATTGKLLFIYSIVFSIGWVL